MPTFVLKRGLKNLLAIGLAALLSLPPRLFAQAAGNDLPDIGSPASSALSLDDEYHIGLQVMRQLRDEGQVIEDPEATEYLNSLGSRLVAQATGD
jgi:predicted Zn-dependent protease